MYRLYFMVYNIGKSSNPTTVALSVGLIRITRRQMSTPTMQKQETQGTTNIDIWNY